MHQRDLRKEDPIGCTKSRRSLRYRSTRHGKWSLRGGQHRVGEAYRVRRDRYVRGRRSVETGLLSKPETVSARLSQRRRRQRARPESDVSLICLALAFAQFCRGRQLTNLRESKGPQQNGTKPPRTTGSGPRRRGNRGAGPPERGGGAERREVGRGFGGALGKTAGNFVGMLHIADDTVKAGYRQSVRM